MPIVLQSTIHLLESELAKARAALQEIQPNIVPVCMSGDELAVGAVAAYRQNLIGRAPDFFYGSRRLSPKEVGLVPVVREVSADESESEGVQTPPQCSVITSPPKPTSLLDVLGNSLVLDHMAPYLSTPALFALASTCRFLHTAVTETPYVFRHLDLTRCRGTVLSEAEEPMDEDISEDDFYSAPLRSIFSKLERRSILQDVRTLVLDGLSVPADLVLDILLKDQFNVNILSIRDCQHLNERKLMQSLQYAVRPSRPQGTPRVKGIYLFTPAQNAQTVARAKYRDWWGSRCSVQPTGNISTTARGPHEGDTPSMDCSMDGAPSQHAWYSPSGKLLQQTIDEGWAETLQKCQGIIAFDAVLCRGPRHNVDLYSSADSSDAQPEGRMFGPAIATVALGPIGCENCHASPEGPAVWGESPQEHFPMLTPLSFHSSSVEVAKRPGLFPDANPGLIARCGECLTDRRCNRCNAWFCDSCLPHPERVRTPLTPHQTAVRGPRDTDIAMAQEQRGLELGVSKDCWECGPTCSNCKPKYERTCQNCQGDYCIEHNDGCSSTMCDWCNTSTRHRMREIY
ncbi:hypothetical protein P168DRAFT_293794 [Aspergillus campestris IBT 28561]|uniref:Ubiquitin fusion degradation protein n=1 Tax=Aspergillus campestris (strain IBT 28561) TaxID=1392248 RepID=A0A2I1CQK6_ASPC2|nr:uncharacterized protein P168DRAFT_293794 [Aspergillus campestris IBT 28561]PKX99909.1 hypothetical protein P168DRAFT_293794 [Aspergillus campestris IBT 28561]